jgi:2-haloalkanoic acid dehalogenase type II
MRLSDFSVLSFDCYGTLIDWESGIFAALQPLIAKGKVALDRDKALEIFGRHEAAQEKETPGTRYSELLTEVHRRLAEEWGVAATDQEHRDFGHSVPDWPAFPDSPEALAYLKQHYKLVILSNVDRESFKGSNARLGVTFDAIYTAEDIGSYKPDRRNFAYMLDALGKRGFDGQDILHTAQSLFHDHVPAKELGLATAWIDRRHEQAGWGATPGVEGARYDIRFTSLAEMAQAHRAEIRRRV